jgi:hypothetical protein
MGGDGRSIRNKLRALAGITDQRAAYPDRIKEFLLIYTALYSMVWKTLLEQRWIDLAPIHIRGVRPAAEVYTCLNITNVQMPL